MRTEDVLLDDRLRGTLWLPDADGPVGGVVLAHGFSATVAMGLAVGFGALAGPRLFPAAEASSFGRLVMLLALVLLGLVTYGAALQVLGVAKLREIASEIRSRA